MGKPFVGIDVGQDCLEVYVRPTGYTWRTPDTPKGQALPVGRLAALGPKLVVLGSTGGLGRAVAYRRRW